MPFTVLLFLHAVIECDTMSTLFSIVKSTACKQMMKHKELSTYAQVFLEYKQKEKIHTVGRKALMHMYNGQSGGRLDALRHCLFHMKVAVGTTFIHVHSLPLLPTSVAAKFHIERVYLQVQQRMGKVIHNPAKMKIMFF